MIDKDKFAIAEKIFDMSAIEDIVINPEELSRIQFSDFLNKTEIDASNSREENIKYMAYYILIDWCHLNDRNYFSINNLSDKTNNENIAMIKKAKIIAEKSIAKYYDDHEKLYTKIPKKVVVVVDYANIMHSVYELSKRLSRNMMYRLCFDKLLPLLIKPDEIIIDKHCVLRQPQNEKKGLVTVLRLQKFKTYCPPGPLDEKDDWDDRKIKENIDEWTSDADVIIFFGGDKHFYEALKHLSGQEKEIKIVSIPMNVSRVYQEFRFIDLSNYINEGFDCIDLSKRENNEKNIETVENQKDIEEGKITESLNVIDESQAIEKITSEESTTEEPIIKPVNVNITINGVMDMIKAQEFIGLFHELAEKFDLKYESKISN